MDMNHILKILAGTLFVSLFCAGATAKPIKHYVFFGMDREKLKDASSFLESKSFAGARFSTHGINWNRERMDMTSASFVKIWPCWLQRIKNSGSKSRT